VHCHKPGLTFKHHYFHGYQKSRGVDGKTARISRIVRINKDGRVYPISPEDRNAMESRAIGFELNMIALYIQLYLAKVFSLTPYSA